MRTWGRIKRGLVIVYLVVVHVALIYFVGDWLLTRYVSFDNSQTASVNDPTEKTKVATPIPVPEEFADQIPDQPTPAPSFVPSNDTALAIPVLGVRPEALTDTFSSARSEQRTHDAIDIMAPAGTPVVAAADGEIIKFFDSERGGITIYQTTADRRFVLYYAHLQRRADDIAVGMTVRKGTTIAYVGDTGNAGAGNFHLHFSIARITDPKRMWEGDYLNPYPILRFGQSLPQ